MRKLIFLIVLLFVLPVVVFAASTLDEVNQKVSNRFEDDLSKLAAIMEEVRRREGITETRVAFGGVDTQIESADYQITYSAEALAFQRARKHPNAGSLKANLEGLRSKILQAKREVGKAL